MIILHFLHWKIKLFFFILQLVHFSGRSRICELQYFSKNDLDKQVPELKHAGIDVQINHVFYT